MKIVYTEATDAHRATTAVSAAGEMMATAPLGDAGTTDKDAAAPAAETDEEPAASLSYLVSFGDGVTEEEFEEGDAQFGVDNDGILSHVLAQIHTAYKTPPAGGHNDKPGKPLTGTGAS